MMMILMEKGRSNETTFKFTYSKIINDDEDGDMVLNYKV